VTVPPIVPDVPHLARNPVIAYLPDDFQKPYPLEPAVVVDVGGVLDQIVNMLHCHTSQFYEWLPYNAGHQNEVPAGDAARRAWLKTKVQARLRQRAERYRDLATHLYGPKRGIKVEYLEAFEPCEYGEPLDEAARRRLFPFVQMT
jgi:hypothetical protein